MACLYVDTHLIEQEKLACEKEEVVAFEELRSTFVLYRSLTLPHLTFMAM
jgi:hypothetical protein